MKTTKLQTKRSINNKTLEKITKEEAKYLIQKNIIHQKHGNYGESLVVIGKFSSGRRKQRYCTPPVYNLLLKLKKKDRLEQYFNLNNTIFSQNYRLTGINSIYYIFDYAVFEDESRTKLKYLIEFYNGDYYDKFKVDSCSNNGIKLLRIKYDEFVNIEEVVNSVSVL